MFLFHLSFFFLHPKVYIMRVSVTLVLDTSSYGISYRMDANMIHMGDARHTSEWRLNAKLRVHFETL